MEIKYLDSAYLTRQNLRIVLGSKRRTLDYRLSALIRKGYLERLKRGSYLNLSYFDKSPDKQALLEYVGGAMVYPSYLSLKSVLAQNGFLSESVFGLTYVTRKKTRRIKTNRATYIYKNLKTALFFGYEPKKVAGLEYDVASLAKALFDLIYLTPFETATQRDDFLFGSRFNWQRLSDQDWHEFTLITKRAQVKKMIKVNEYLSERGVV